MPTPLGEFGFPNRSPSEETEQLQDRLIELRDGVENNVNPIGTIVDNMGFSIRNLRDATSWDEAQSDIVDLFDLLRDAVSRIEGVGFYLEDLIQLLRVVQAASGEDTDVFRRWLESASAEELPEGVK